MSSSVLKSVEDSAHSLHNIPSAFGVQFLYDSDSGVTFVEFSSNVHSKTLTDALSRVSSLHVHGDTPYDALESVRGLAEILLLPALPSFNAGRSKPSISKVFPVEDSSEIIRSRLEFNSFYDGEILKHGEYVPMIDLWTCKVKQEHVCMRSFFKNTGWTVIDDLLEISAGSWSTHSRQQTIQNDGYNDLEVRPACNILLYHHALTIILKRLTSRDDYLSKYDHLKDLKFQSDHPIVGREDSREKYFSALCELLKK